MARIPRLSSIPKRPPHQPQAFVVFSNHPEGRIVSAVDVSPDLKWLAVAHSFDCDHFWKISSGRLDRVIPGCEIDHGTWDIGFTSESRIIRGGQYQEGLRIQRWNIEKLALKARFSDEIECQPALGFSRERLIVAYGAEKNVIVVRECKTGRLLHRLRGHGNCLVRPGFDPGGKLIATTGCDGMIRVWDLASGKLLRETKRGPGRPNSLVFSSDSKEIIYPGEAKKLNVWRWREDRLRVIHLPGTVNLLALHPGGNILVGAADDNHHLFLLDLKGRAPVNSLCGHADGTRALRFTDDGRFFVTGNMDGTFAFWRVLPNDQHPLYKMLYENSMGWVARPYHVGPGSDQE